MRSLQYVGLSLVLLSAAVCRAEPPTPPRIFCSDGADMLAAKTAVQNGSDPALRKYVAKAAKEADKLLDMKPPSVMDKAFTPPSGDKHDYASLSPYWWPDPSKPDGKPYIRKDGEYNPERSKYDLEPLDSMTKAVQDLSSAYYLTGDERYAAKAAELIRVWFINPQTRMNPNLKYAQFVPGLDLMRASGVLEGNRSRRVIDGVGLLASSPSWTAQDDAALKAWFGQMLDYLRNSPQGKDEASQPNNHGTWFHVQAATYALFTDNKPLAKQLIETAFKARIASQFNPDGFQPEEGVRTQSFHYHRFNLLALFDLAMLGDRVGLDLWNYKTSDGKSLRLGLDFLAPYALGEKEWPHQQIHEVKKSDMLALFRRAANAYHEKKYEDAAKKLDEDDDVGMFDIMFPAHMK
jgi:hypothetical protein